MNRRILNIVTALAVMLCLYTTPAMAVDDVPLNMCTMACGTSVTDVAWFPETSTDFIETISINTAGTPPTVVSTQCTTKVFYRKLICDEGPKQRTYIRITRIDRTCSPAMYDLYPYGEIRRAIEQRILGALDPLNLIDESEGMQSLDILYPRCATAYMCTIPILKYAMQPCSAVCCIQSYERVTSGCNTRWQWAGSNGGECEFRYEGEITSFAACGYIGATLLGGCNDNCEPIYPVYDRPKQ